MSQTVVVELVVSSKDVERWSEELWELPLITGIEEASLKSATGIFEVPDEFEILEFGSEAAKKCAKWVHRQSFRGRDRLILKVYFTGSLQEVEASVQAWMATKPASLQIQNVYELESQDYVEAYKKSIRGRVVGRDIWVGPPWEKGPKEINLHITIEPGLAFGTGDHPTTQLCLEALEYLKDEGGTAPKRILDLGCGTGVLALASKKMFPHSHVIASDIDPQCQEELAKLLHINHSENLIFESFFGHQGTVEALSEKIEPVDLLISNIYAEVLAKSIGSIRRILKPGGLWVASGILQGPSEDILLQAMEKTGFQTLERKSQQRVRSDLNLAQGLEEETENWVLLKVR